MHLASTVRMVVPCRGYVAHLVIDQLSLITIVT